MHNKTFVEHFILLQEGDLGLVERTHEPVKSPLELEIGHLAADEKIAYIASGGQHLVLLSTAGRVFTLGNGFNGQLGRLSDEQLAKHSEELLRMLVLAVF